MIETEFTRVETDDPLPFDVDALVRAVADRMGVAPLDLPLVTGQHRVHVAVETEADLRDLAFGCSAAGAFPCGSRFLGIYFPPGVIRLVRLDWPGLWAHELTHWLQDVTLNGAFDELQAQRMADAFAR